MPSENISGQSRPARGDCTMQARGRVANFTTLLVPELGNDLVMASDDVLQP